MEKTLYSPLWYRVAGLKPRLKSHAEIHRHHYRGELWYVLQDHATGRFQRFTPAAYLLIGLMDGKRTVQQIWNSACLRLGDDAPTQEEVIRLLTQLHAADALQGDVLPDPGEVQKRFKKQRFMKRMQNVRSPLFMRMSLFDPERFLTRYEPVLRPFFSWPGLVLWLAVVIPAVFQVAVHWPDLTRNLTDRVLAPSNLLVLWLTFPILKALHEFGHAFAVKIKGGEVHDMGIMLLVFTPIPYVDASAASALRRKWDRFVVGAAGLLVELFFAGVAMFVWLNAEPGPLRAVAFNTMLIAGISSLLFNGNPLLRYDAYYILTDLIEIPNLGTRGNRYIGYLIQRYLFGMKHLEAPVATRGEKTWFIVYSLAAFLYRIVIYFSIVLFVASRFFIIGMMFAAWAVINMFIFPVGKMLHFLLASPKLIRNRFRAVMVSTAVIGGLVLFVTLYPMPLSTVAEGVIWIPDDAVVRAGSEGFVEEILVLPGNRIAAGTPLIACSDPFLPARIRVLESRLKELEALYDTQRRTDRVASEITRDDIEQASAELEDAQQRNKELTILSGNKGFFVLPEYKDMPGRFVSRGEPLGYILQDDTRTVRTVVTQADIDLVRYETVRVDVRHSGDLSEIIPAMIEREVPAATHKLPSPVLSREGGGDIALDPNESGKMKTFQKIFLFDVELLDEVPVTRVGSRVYVRFGHGNEPLVKRWYRMARRLFLKRFSA